VLIKRQSQHLAFRAPTLVRSGALNLQTFELIQRGLGLSASQIHLSQ
jgi:hypothetical protein